MVDQIRFFAGAARVLEGRAAGEYMAGHTSWVRREPIGVVGQVTPWNYPMMMAVWKFAPAIAAGNTVVLKPSDTTPETTLLLAELAAEFLPAGRASTSSPATATPAGRWWSTRPRHGGDHRVGPGRHGGRRSAAHRRQAGAPRARRQGAGHRLRRRRPRGGGRGHRRRRLLQRRSGLHGGDPGARRAAASTTTSWRRSAEQARARPRSATAGRRGRAVRRRSTTPTSWTGHRLPRPAARPRRRSRRRPPRQALGDGFFLEPTVVSGLPPGRRGVQDEIFGPVITVQRFTDEAEAIAWANGVRVRARVHRVDEGLRPGDADGQARSTSAASGSTPTSRSSPRCRTAASSTPATARTCRCTASRTTRGSSTSWPTSSPDRAP